MLVQVSADIVHHKKAFGRLIIQNISMTASRILQTLAGLSQHDIRLVINLTHEADHWSIGRVFGLG